MPHLYAGRGQTAHLQTLRLQRVQPPTSPPPPNLPSPPVAIVSVQAFHLAARLGFSLQADKDGKKKSKTNNGLVGLALAGTMQKFCESLPAFEKHWSNVQLPYLQPYLTQPRSLQAHPTPAKLRVAGLPTPARCRSSHSPSGRTRKGRS